MILAINHGIFLMFQPSLSLDLLAPQIIHLLVKSCQIGANHEITGRRLKMVSSQIKKP